MNVQCPLCLKKFEIDNTLSNQCPLSLIRHVQAEHPSSFQCDYQGCTTVFTNGSGHIAHLRSRHSFQENEVLNLGISSVEPPPGVHDSIIFQDPTLEHDVYISYCHDNTVGGAAPISQFHDPKRMTSELSKHFKPWIDKVCLGPVPTGDFYEDRALAIQKVKVVVAFVSPEYAANEQCKMEYEFAFKSLKKPVLPVIIRKGIENTLIEQYIREGERVPLRLDAGIPNEVAFVEKMGYLVDAVRKMITSTDEERETIRLSYLSVSGPSAPPADLLDNGQPPPTYEQFLQQEQAILGRNIRQRTPGVGDHVIAHHYKHSYYRATVVSFNRHDMTYTIRWDDNDPSGRTPAVHLVARDCVPSPDQIHVGQRVFFPQGSYSGTEGNNEGGLRYHEGIITHVMGSSPDLVYNGIHAKGDTDDKWVTYNHYSYGFSLPLDRLRIAPNPYNALITSNIDV